MSQDYQSKLLRTSQGGGLPFRLDSFAADLGAGGIPTGKTVGEQTRLLGKEGFASHPGGRTPHLAKCATQAGGFVADPRAGGRISG